MALFLHHGARSTAWPGWGANRGGALSPPRHSSTACRVAPPSPSLSLSRVRPLLHNQAAAAATLQAALLLHNRIRDCGGRIRRWWPDLGGGEHIRPKTSISDRLAWKRRPRPVASRASPRAHHYGARHLRHLSRETLICLSIWLVRKMRPLIGCSVGARFWYPKHCESPIFAFGWSRRRQS